MGLAKRYLCLAIAMAGVMAGSAEANLIVNGGFETPGAPSGKYMQYTNNQNIGGWTATGKDVLVINSTYTETGITFNSNSGSYALDITGAGNTAPEDGVYQDIATAAGQIYLISFFVGRGDDSSRSPSEQNYSTPSSIALTISDSSTSTLATIPPEATFTNEDKTPGQINWKQFTKTFTAVSASTRIAFTNATPTRDNAVNNYAGLDDVSVVATPEPSAVVLTASALPLALVLIRRRRQAARPTSVVA